MRVIGSVLMDERSPTYFRTYITINYIYIWFSRLKLEVPTFTKWLANIPLLGSLNQNFSKGPPWLTWLDGEIKFNVIRSTALLWNISQCCGRSLVKPNDDYPHRDNRLKILGCVICRSNTNLAACQVRNGESAPYSLNCIAFCNNWCRLSRARRVYFRI